MCGLVQLARRAICVLGLCYSDERLSFRRTIRNQAGEAEQKDTNPGWHAACGSTRGFDNTNLTDPDVIVSGRVFERSVVLSCHAVSFVRLHVLIMPDLLLRGVEPRLTCGLQPSAGYRSNLDRVTFTRITADPKRMGGVPCVRDLRFPVATVVAMGCRRHDGRRDPR